MSQHSRVWKETQPVCLGHQRKKVVYLVFKDYKVIIENIITRVIYVVHSDETL